MYFLEILLAIRNTRRAFKTIRISRMAKLAAEIATTEAIATQAAAYGFEIGRGKALVSEVQTSNDNPFLDTNWRERLPNDNT